MADFPEIGGSDPFADDPGLVDMIDGGQVDNVIRGINRGTDGFRQAFADMKEALGLEEAGYGDWVTQELKKEQAALLDATYDDAQLPGAGAAEFVGETLPLFAIPFGATPLRAAALGGVTSAGFFHDDPDNRSRFTDIAIGTGSGGLLKRLMMGGRAKKAVENEIDQLALPAPEKQLLLTHQPSLPPQPRGLGAPPQRAGQNLLTDQRQLALPRPAPKAHSPMAPRNQGLGADDFQNAASDTLERTGVGAMRKASVREVETATAKLAAAEAKLAKMERKLANALKKLPGAKTKAAKATRTKTQKALNEVTKNKVAAKALSRVVTGKPLKKAVPGGRKAAAAEAAKVAKAAPAAVAAKAAPVSDVPGQRQAPFRTDMLKAMKEHGDLIRKGNRLVTETGERLTKYDALHRIDELTPANRYVDKNVSHYDMDDIAEMYNSTRASYVPKTGGPGGKQGGFINTDLQAMGTGAFAGGVVGAQAGEGDPLAIAAGVVGGAALARAMARRLDPVVTNKMKKDIRKADADGSAYTAKVSRLVKAKDLSMEALSGVRTEGPRVLDQFMGAVMTRLENISPRVAAALSNAEFQQHFIAGQWIQAGGKAFAKIEQLGLTDVQARKFKIAMLNSTRGGSAYLRGIGKSDEAVKDLEKIFAEAGDYLKEVDLGKNLRRNYMARMVVDTTAFEGIEQVDTYLAQLAKKKRIKLTDFEKQVALTEVINGALTHTGDKTSWGRAAANLQRRTNKVTDKNVDAYADLQHGFNDYAEQVTTQVERRRFFKGQGVKVDDLGPNSENLDGVADRLRKQLTGGELTPDQVDEVASLIKMRFGPGEQAPHKFWQNFKNLTYMGLLGNPLSAMTQFGDIALSAHRNGIANTASAVVEQIMNRGQAVRGLDKETLLGIRNAAADFASRTSTRDALNWSLKYSGFQAMDKFGKNTFIASALKKNRQMDKASFTKKWAERFDPEAQPGGPTPRTDELFKKVQSFEEINDANREDLGFMLWNELSGVQPIALSALPEMYLRNPNGRTAYMLQSFTLKLFDVMRKDIYNLAKAGQYGQATTNAAKLTTLFVTLNGGVDGAKNFILGRDQELDEVVMNNFLKMTGANKFMVDDAMRNGLGQAAIKLIAPPTVLLDAATDPREALKLTPVVGKLMESRIPE